MDFASFFAMGGYGGYVWPAYALAVVVMAALVVASLRSVRTSEAELERLQQMRPARRRRNAQADVPVPEKQAS